jgi:GTP-binding protein LepA
MLDSMDLERERGITIKAHPVTMSYPAKDGKIYKLNLLDTPGHVDFSYEVSRSLAACEGALLLVDASQGVEAQTVANLNLAMQQNLTSSPSSTRSTCPTPMSKKPSASSRTSCNSPPMKPCPPPPKWASASRRSSKPSSATHPSPVPDDGYLRASVFDSVFDPYRGVVSYVRVISGIIARSKIRMMSTGNDYEVKDVGVFRPKMTPCEKLDPGDVGYLIANVKTTADVKIGDTVTESRRPAPEAAAWLQGNPPARLLRHLPREHRRLRVTQAAVGKLQINDSAFTFMAESSAALGFGFRCGFLGLLHMEIIQERLRREFNMDVISTYPSSFTKSVKPMAPNSMVDNPTFLPPELRPSTSSASPWSKCTS